MKRLLGLGLDLARAQLPTFPNHANGPVGPLGRGAAPFKLTFVCTDVCSCRCAICSLWQEPRTGATTEEMTALFRANPHLSWINLSGGEVVEREDFVPVVEAAVSATRVAALDFPTAGQRPAEIEQKVRAVLRLPLPRLFVTVSIDGPPAIHDRLRGTEGAFVRAVETFERLRRVRDGRLGVYVGLTLSSRNDEDPDGLVDALLAAAPSIGRGDLHFNLAHHAPHYYRNRAGDVPDGARAAAFLRRERARRPRSFSPFALLESAYWRLAGEFLAGGSAPVPCAALRASAYVDPDLRLYPCATWDRPLVDLREVDYSLAAAVRLAEVRVAREEARTGRCPGCWTPCEAYPTMLSQVPRTLGALGRAAGDST